MNEINELKFLDENLAGKSDALIQHAKKLRSLFLEEEDSEYWLTITNIFDFFELFQKTYLLMAICPTKDVYSRFDEILDKRMNYKWILGADVFLKKIEEINRSKIVYIPINYAFFNWIKYLDVQIGVYCHTELLKIIANLNQFEQTADKKLLMKLRAGYDPQPEFENYFRRRKYNAGNKKPVDLLLNETLEILAEFIGGAEKHNLLADLKQDFMAVLNGNTEDAYLARIFTTSVLLPGYPEIEKFVVFYDLFRFLLKDKFSDQFGLLSKEEFEDRPSSYENNFRKYQKSKMMDLLGLR